MAATAQSSDGSKRVKREVTLTGAEGQGARPGRKRERKRKAPDGMGTVDQVREAGWTDRADGKRAWRSELWRGRVSIDGKRRVVYGKTQADALKNLEALKGDAARGLLVEPNRRTLGNLLDEYIADGEARGLRPKTLFF